MPEDFALFLFLAAGSVALFTFLSVAHWVITRSEERKAIERLALLRKLADQPGDNARLVLEQLREDETRKEHRKERHVKRNALQSASIWLAVGIGVSVMLAAIAPPHASPLWTIGLTPILIGAVLFVFALLNKPSPSLKGDSSDSN